MSLLAGQSAATTKCQLYNFTANSLCGCYLYNPRNCSIIEVDVITGSHSVENEFHMATNLSSNLNWKYVVAVGRGHMSLS
jgi:hypothetical protein